MDDRTAIATTLRKIGASIIDLADHTEGNVPGGSSLVARQIACLREFDVPPGARPQSPEASAAFRSTA
jgi:hypothetical protein